jgi:formylglycine-generating enzyme required for sulfatase activity
LRYYVRGKVSQYVTANFLGYRQNPIGYSTLGAMVLARSQSTLEAPQPQPAPPQPPQAEPPVVPAPNPVVQSIRTKINPKDGAEMVLVPAGEFTRGNVKGSEDEKPQRQIYLDEYWIYKTEVTVAQYRRFCTATNRKMPQTPRWGWNDDHPVVGVDWEDAQAYCKWAGVRLPTEAEWEKAARGTDSRTYPWGEAFDSANVQSATQRGSGVKSTMSVGAFPTGASPYGCVDMAGNAEEWCADWYFAGYYAIAPARNPTGPPSGTRRVVRGGSFTSTNSRRMRTTDRYHMPVGYHHANFGFRCVQSQP